MFVRTSVSHETSMFRKQWDHKLSSLIYLMVNYLYAENLGHLNAASLLSQRYSGKWLGFGECKDAVRFICCLTG